MLGAEGTEPFQSYALCDPVPTAQFETFLFLKLSEHISSFIKTC